MAPASGVAAWTLTGTSSWPITPLGAEVSQRQPELKPLAVLPLAMGLEIMAQAGSALYQGLGVRALSGVRAHRWLAADRGWLDLMITARPERGPDGEFLARVEPGRTGRGDRPGGDGAPCAGWCVLPVRHTRQPGSGTELQCGGFL